MKKLADIIDQVELICASVWQYPGDLDVIYAALDAYDALVQQVDGTFPTCLKMLDLSLTKCLGDALAVKNEKEQIPGVYVIEYSNNTVKIGCTRYFTNRKNQLSTQGGLEICRNRFFPCDYMHNVEKFTHAALGYARLNGEFFNVSFEEACETVESVAND